jgi:hypothetical protein
VASSFFRHTGAATQRTATQSCTGVRSAAPDGQRAREADARRRVERCLRVADVDFREDAVDVVARALLIRVAARRREDCEEEGLGGGVAGEAA